MRSIFNSAIRALTILGLSAAVLAFAISTSSAVLADGSLETMSGGSFTRFGSDTVRSAERSTGRRTTTTTRASLGSRATGDDTSPGNRPRGRQVASLGGRGGDFTAPKPGRSLSGGGNVRWVADSGCLTGSLRSAVSSVAANYGSVTVSSTCRSAGHNARVGGAPKSYHLTGNAVDFRVSGNISGAASYLAGLGGGYKHYGGGLFHVDTGPRRPF
jgi:hypothetical protein